MQPGDIVEFTVRGAKSEEKYSVDVNYAGLVEDISVGDTVLVDNGMIRFEVLEKHRNRVRCRVMTPGTLGSRRHINLPGVRVNLPPLTKKDIADVTLGAELGVDYVALSFVREASDIEELRGLLNERGSRACIVAKIEDQSAVRSLEEIMKAADAVMVARGDLGIECPMEELPIIQRRIVKMSIRFRQTGRGGYAHARIDDFKSTADTRGNYRRCECSLRTGGRNHVERRNKRRPLSGRLRPDSQPGRSSD